MTVVVVSQPMYFPWVGLLEQVRLADVYVHYDDVQFSKGSFVNRVQIKTARGPQWLTVPLADLHLGQRIDQVRVNERRDWRGEHRRQLEDAYAAAPHLESMLALVDAVHARPHPCLGGLARESLMALCDAFGLTAGRRFLDIGELGIGGSGTERVLAVVQALGGTTYVTGHGARHYLDHEAFGRAGIAVRYMAYEKVRYPQLHGEFTPYVSALDLLANAGAAGVDVVRSGTLSWQDFPTR